MWSGNAYTRIQSWIPSFRECHMPKTTEVELLIRMCNNNSIYIVPSCLRSIYNCRVWNEKKRKKSILHIYSWDAKECMLLLHYHFSDSYRLHVKKAEKKNYILLRSLVKYDEECVVNLWPLQVFVCIILLERKQALRFD